MEKAHTRPGSGTPGPRRLLGRPVSMYGIVSSAALVVGGLCLSQILRLTTPLVFPSSAASPHKLSDAAAEHFFRQFNDALAQCAAASRLPPRPDPASRTENPRWFAEHGHQSVVVLRNTTLFDGEKILTDPMDVIFAEGLVVSVTRTADQVAKPSGAVEYNLGGHWVTPGLVDMHAHHLTMSWPATEVSDDVNEVNPDTSAVPAMGRIEDALKPYDLATAVICSGGVTSSLILPGSANLMSGEGVPVKNVPRAARSGEKLVSAMLLEAGVPPEERRRYMKLAYGENPRDVWGYTRQGNALHLRAHLDRARTLMRKQDDYCARIGSFGTGSSGSSPGRVRTAAHFVVENGPFPEVLALESTVGLLRGRVLPMNHNYETEDIETMLRIASEFGFRVRAFHHATEAWQAPEMLREADGGAANLTVAIFSEFSLYKQEASAPNLHAAAILHGHGLPVAFKSDHSGFSLNSKYLMRQAAVGHAFHLPAEAALRAVTSVPARSMDLDFRIGYVRPGFDADLVIWDGHPLGTGATPLQVFVDGQPQLASEQVFASMARRFDAPPDSAPGSVSAVQPQVRYEPEEATRKELCMQAEKPGQSFVITGIRRAFVDHHPALSALLAKHKSNSTAPAEDLQLVIDNGSVVCLGPETACATPTAALTSSPLTLSLKRGYLTPGLTALTRGMGMREIDGLPSTGDGQTPRMSIFRPDSVVHAHHGVWLDGKYFARARLGGVTRAISTPLGDLDSSGFVQGVSVAFGTSGRKSLLDGGIVQDDVALHLSLDSNAISGDTSSTGSTGSISNAIQQLRIMLTDGLTKNNDTVYGAVAAGRLPLLVYADNKYDIQQLILVKRDFPQIYLVLQGGAESPFVAKSLASAGIPVILTQDRPSIDTFHTKDTFIGPPMTRSVASYLTEAGVEYGISVSEQLFPGPYRIHALGPEAGWTAKFAGLDEAAALRLVSTNIESILRLPPSKDAVLFEGSPLEFGATAVLSFITNDDTGKLEVATCFPQENELVETSVFI